MNYRKLVNTIKDLSAKSEKKLNINNTLGFNHLDPKSQEYIIDSANKALGRNPVSDDLVIDKKLLNSIKTRLNNPNFRNELKSNKFDDFSLDDEATKFLEANQDKISKDLEDYAIESLDYKDKANRTDLSKYVDADEETELPQNEAIDNLLYAENEPSIYKGGIDEFTHDLNKSIDNYAFSKKYYPEIDAGLSRAMSNYELNPKDSIDELDFINTMMDNDYDKFSTLKEGLKNRTKDRFYKFLSAVFKDELQQKYPDLDFKPNRKEADWLNKAIQDYKEDVLLRDPSTLPSYSYTRTYPFKYETQLENLYKKYPKYKVDQRVDIVKNGLGNKIDYTKSNGYVENINTPTRKTALNEMYNKYKDINKEPIASAWKKLQKDEFYPSMVYSKYQQDIFKDKWGNEYHPLDHLRYAIRSKYKTRNPTKAQQSLDRYLYNTTKDEQRLVNEDLLPKNAIDTDSITGKPIDQIYKYGDIDNLERTEKGFNYLDNDELEAIYNKETFGDDGYEQWWSNALNDKEINERLPDPILNEIRTRKAKSSFYRKIMAPMAKQQRKDRFK